MKKSEASQQTESKTALTVSQEECGEIPSAVAVQAALTHRGQISFNNLVVKLQQWKENSYSGGSKFLLSHFLRIYLHFINRRQLKIFLSR